MLIPRILVGLGVLVCLIVLTVSSFTVMKLEDALTMWFFVGVALVGGGIYLALETEDDH